MAYTPRNANGQATMANSEPVVIASDQSAVPASQSGTWNVTNVSGTVSLPTGAATAANQATIIGHVDGVETLLGTIDADTSTLAGAVAGTEMQVDVLTMPTTTVQATDLDIRNLAPATDTVALGDGSATATIRNLAANDALNVAIVDGAGDQITSFGGGTQYTEDAAAAANPIGTSMILVREDARAGGLTTTDGDNVAARGNNKGELYVKTTDSDALLTTIDADTSTLAGAVAGTEMQVDVLTMPTVTVTATNLDVQSGGADLATTTQAGAIQTAVELIDDTIFTDDTSTHTPATTKVTGIGAVAAPTDTTLNANDIGMPGMSVGRELYGVIRDAAGNLRGANVNASNQLSVSVDNTVTVGSHAVTNAGTFATQATLQAGTAYAGKVRLTDGTTDTDIRDLTNSNALNVAIVDGSGDQITTFGGGTQYTEADTDATITGTAVMWEDAADTLRAVSAAKPLPVDLGANNDVTVTGTVTVDLGVNNDVTLATLPDTAASDLATINSNTDSLAVVGGGTEATAVRVTIANDSTGVVSIDDNGGAITVDGSLTSAGNVTNAGTFVVQENGSALTALQLIDDIVYTDDTSTHSTGTSKGALMMAAATPTDTAVNANDIGAVGMTNNREMYVSLRDIAGTAAVNGSGTSTGALRVELPTNGTGAIATVSTVSALGTGTTGPMKAEDVAHATGDMGIPAWSVRDNATSGQPTTTFGGNGDYAPLVVDDNYRLYTQSVGNVAHDGADAGAPVKIGGKARQTNPTAVADADRADIVVDDIGRIVTADSHVRDLVVQNVTTITSSTSETTILSAGAAGVFHDAKSIMVANKSASATLITIRDATAGSAVAYIYCPAGDTRGVVFNTPFKQTTAANNWTAQCGTSVDSVYITIQAVKNV